MSVCPTPPSARRRYFWTTRVDANGEKTSCHNANVCGEPGLFLEMSGELSNVDYLSSLCINMLMTDGRQPDSVCGYRPGSLGGYWAESFLDDDIVGTLVRTVQPQGSTQDIVNLVQAHVEATLSRLVTRGVASSIDVVVSYTSGGQYGVQVNVYGIGGVDAKVGLITQHLPQGWVWETLQ